jgi:hypothetical protein
MEMSLTDSVVSNADLKVIIWNAKISSARSAVDKRSLRISKRFIAGIISQNIDFIGLIEIDENSVEYFNSVFTRFNLPYRVANGTQQIGTTRFDTCIIYRSDKFVLMLTPNKQDCENTDSSYKGELYKSGQKYDFFDINNKIQLSFVLVHWPSLLTPEIQKKRENVAQNLRFHLNRWLLKNNNIIIAGDFNTEPYCSSLTEELCSFREPESPSRSKNGFELFYNPSWNFFNVPPPLSISVPYITLGTYFYRQKNYQHWFNYDQVMFAKNLIEGNSGWKYLGNSLKILNLFDLTNKAERWSDHLPIQFSLTWRS